MDAVNHGMAIQSARVAMGWKAARLAALLRASETTLSRWENGHQQPYRRHREQLCRVLGRDPVDLGFEEDLLAVDRRELVQKLMGALGTVCGHAAGRLPLAWSCAGGLRAGASGAGTFPGNTYSALFGQRVGRMVADGVVDPSTTCRVRRSPRPGPAPAATWT